MGEGGVEAERDHDRRAVGYADRRRERSERLSQPLLCPFLPSPPPATIRERKVGKVVLRRGKQAGPPPVVPRVVEAVPPPRRGTTPVCFAC